MEIQAKLLHKLDLVTGNSPKGEWKKKEMIFETLEQYPKKVCVAFWGDKVDEANQLNIGDSCTISINVESREYNGKWFTEVKAWKIVKGQATSQAPKEEPTQEDLNDSSDNLPF